MGSKWHRGSVGWVVFALAAAAVLLALRYNDRRVDSACSEDTSYCATSQTRDTIYRGRLPGVSSVQRFEVVFASRRGLANVTFNTDSSGRFCFIWAEERATPLAQPRGPVVPARFQGHVSGGNTPAGCERSDATIPWYRSEEVKSAWQPRSVLVLGVFALAALALSALYRGAGWRTARAVGLIAAAATPVLCAIVWSSAS